MSKDQLYGGIIFIVSLIITVVYIAAFFAKPISTIIPVLPAWLEWWAIAIPVFLFVLAALAIVIWIGWTMLTTQPPPALEDIEPKSANKLSQNSKKKRNDVTH